MDEHELMVPRLIPDGTKTMIEVNRKRIGMNRQGLAKSIVKKIKTANANSAYKRIRTVEIDLHKEQTRQFFEAVATELGVETSIIALSSNAKRWEKSLLFCELKKVARLESMFDAILRWQKEIVKSHEPMLIDFGINHADRVVKNCEIVSQSILIQDGHPNELGSFTPEEAFVFVVGCVLHDIGHFFKSKSTADFLGMKLELLSQMRHGFAVSTALQNELRKSMPFGIGEVQKHKDDFLFDRIGLLTEFHNTSNCRQQVIDRLSSISRNTPAQSSVRDTAIRFMVGALQIGDKVDATRKRLVDLEKVDRLFAYIRTNGVNASPDTIESFNRCLRYYYVNDSEVRIDLHSKSLDIRFTNRYPLELYRDNAGTIPYIERRRIRRFHPKTNNCISEVLRFGFPNKIRFASGPSFDDWSGEIVPAKTFRHVTTGPLDRIAPHSIELTPLREIAGNAIHSVSSDLTILKLVNRPFRGVLHQGVSIPIDTGEYTEQNRLCDRLIFNVKHWRIESFADGRHSGIYPVEDRKAHLRHLCQESQRRSPIDDDFHEYLKLTEQMEIESCLYLALDSGDADYENIAWIMCHFTEKQTASRLFEIGREFIYRLKKSEIGPKLLKEFRHQKNMAQECLHDLNKVHDDIHTNLVRDLENIPPNTIGEPADIAKTIFDIDSKLIDFTYHAQPGKTIGEKINRADLMAIDFSLAASSPETLKDMLQYSFALVLPKLLGNVKYRPCLVIRELAGMPTNEIGVVGKVDSNDIRSIGHLFNETQQVDEFLNSQSIELFPKTTLAENKFAFLLPIMIFASISCGRIHVLSEQEFVGIGVELPKSQIIR